MFSIQPNPYLLFFILTLFVVILVERVEGIILGSRYLERYRKEMEDVERELNEYYVYSLLAIALNDKQAYQGYQMLMSEKYWPFFFRRLMLETSFYFVLLSPYMLITNYILVDAVPNAFSWVLFVAIAFFTARVGFRLIRDFIHSWRDAKVAEKQMLEVIEQYKKSQHMYHENQNIW